MSSFSHGVRLCLIFGFLAVSVLPVAAADEASGTNVVVTIVKGRLQGKSKVPIKTYQLVAVDSDSEQHRAALVDRARATRARIAAARNRRAASWVSSRAS